MPLAQLNADELKVELAKASSDVLQIFEDVGLPDQAQGAFAKGGITNIRRLAHYAENETEVRANLEREFGIKPADGIETRVLVSDFDAKKQSAREAEIRVDKRTSDVKELPRSIELKSMRSAYIQAYGKGSLEDAHCPS